MRGQDSSVATGTQAEAAAATTDYLAAREDLLRRPGPPSSGRRSALVALTDDWLTELFRLSGAQEEGSALVAVGGYGRGSLAVGSDLDLLLLQRDPSPESADRIWYPCSTSSSGGMYLTGACSWEIRQFWQWSQVSVHPFGPIERIELPGMKW